MAQAGLPLSQEIRGCHGCGSWNRQPSMRVGAGPDSPSCCSPPGPSAKSQEGAGRTERMLHRAALERLRSGPGSSGCVGSRMWQDNWAMGK